MVVRLHAARRGFEPEQGPVAFLAVRRPRQLRAWRPGRSGTTPGVALVSARVVGVARLGEVGPEVHDLLAEDILIGREGEVEDPGRVENVDDLGPVAHPAVAEGDWAPAWKGQGVVPDVQPDVGESSGPHHTRGIARGAGED